MGRHPDHIQDRNRCPGLDLPDGQGNDPRDLGRAGVRHQGLNQRHHQCNQQLYRGRQQYQD